MKSSSGRNWSAWGLGLSGWAGSLHETNLAAWSQIQKSFQYWYDRYPKDLAAAVELAKLPAVELDLLRPMKSGDAPRPDVKTYQTYLRAFLTKVGRLGNLNPSGATGFYGKETIAMTTTAYQYQASVTGNLGWLRGDLTYPGSGMLNAIGLRDK